MSVRNPPQAEKAKHNVALQSTVQNIVIFMFGWVCTGHKEYRNALTGHKLPIVPFWYWNFYFNVSVEFILCSFLMVLEFPF